MDLTQSLNILLAKRRARTVWFDLLILALMLTGCVVGGFAAGGIVDLFSIESALGSTVVFSLVWGVFLLMPPALLAYRYEPKGKYLGARKLRQAVEAFHLSDPATCLELLEEAVALRPDDADIRSDGLLEFQHLYQRGYLAVGRWAEAIPMLQRDYQAFEGVRGEREMREEIAVQIGTCFFELKQYRAAQEWFKKLPLGSAKRADDTLNEARYGQALCFEALGEPSKAIALYEKIYVADVAFRDVEERLRVAQGV